MSQDSNIKERIRQKCIVMMILSFEMIGSYENKKKKKSASRCIPDIAGKAEGT